MNRYQQINQVVNAERQAKWREHDNNRLRWNNILRYMDYDDLFTASGKLRTRGAIMRRAAGVFRSAWSNDRSTHAADLEVSLTPTFGRDVERDTMLSMLEDALKNYHVSPLTVSQQETVVLERIAKENGVGASTLISNVLSISVRAAQYRLQSARGKTFVFDDEFDIMTIKQAMLQTPRYCPFCAEQSRVTVIPVPTNAMCWEHINRFINKQDFGYYPRKEYERVVMQSHVDYWQAVRDTLDESRVVAIDNKVIQMPILAEQKRKAG